MPRPVLPVHKLARCSSAHITERDAQLLEQNHIVGYSYSEGWFVLIVEPALLDETIGAMREAGFTEDMINLYQACAEQQVALLQIDRDADPIPGLPTFTW